MNGCVYPSIRRKEQPADSRTKPRPEEKNGARNRKETNKSRRTGAPLKAKRQLPPHSAAMHEGKGRPKKEPGHSIFSLLFRLLSVCFSLGFLVSLRLVFAQVVDPNFVKEEILPALLATRFQCFFFFTCSDECSKLSSDWLTAIRRVFLSPVHRGPCNCFPRKAHPRFSSFTCSS